MPAGRLRHRIAFDQRVVTSDGGGGQQGAFEEEFIVHAQLIPRLGGEEVMQARLAGRQPVTISVRRSAQTRAITPEWRARDADTGTIYNIRSILDPEDRRGWRDLLCDTGTAVAT
jgi:head-tail adaptor